MRVVRIRLIAGLFNSFLLFFFFKRKTVLEMRISDWGSDVCSSDLLRAGVERSHLGKIERGEHQPNLGLVLKIAVTLDCSAAELLAATEARLPKGWFRPNREA